MPVTKLEVLDRSSFANGESFGDVGAYERIDGIAHFAIDPLNDRNTAITDLELAPRDANGKVVFSSEFTLLKPVESGKGNRRLFFDVINRGRKTAFGFNDVPSITDHTAPLDPGNGFLMRQGYAVMFCGWQPDLPDTPGLLGMQGQEALVGGRSLEGRMLCQFQANAPTQTFLLSDQNHAPRPALDIDEPSATLTVRDLPNDSPTPIDRGEWSFIRLEEGEAGQEPCHVYMPSGFQPGKIYQLVYTTKGSSIVGLGFAVVRDAVSFIKYADADAGNPLADAIDYAYAVGRSQSGRFLRQMIHAGLNEDEEERMTLDGIIPHVAGAMRGEFNLRFGQPSKDVCFIIPELFPFTDTHQVDPVTGAEGSMLECLEERGKVPKIMFINTSAEYWRGDAALIHTDLVTMQDAPESPNVRRYHFAGCQHGTGDFPPIEVRTNDGIRGQLAFNSVNYNPLFRAALTNLDRWVSTGKEPPASRHPNLTDGTAMDSQVVMDKFLDLPGVRITPQTTRAMRMDYGPELHLGRTVELPPSEGETYPALVSDIDENFNERGGIRLPDLTVPVATYTGWNLRDTSIGNPNLFIGITGGLAGWTLRLPTTAAEREALGDPRLSVEERYASREDYLRQVETAAEGLVEEGYMLAEDIERVVAAAGRKFDYFTTETNGS